MLIERKNITINRVDFSAFFCDVGYEVNYVRVQGNNGGLMQDGSTILDTIKHKAIVTLPVYPLTESQLQTLLNALSDDYVTLVYFDPKSGAYKTISAITDEPRWLYRGMGADGNSYWTNDTVTLTEQ